VHIAVVCALSHRLRDQVSPNTTQYAILHINIKDLHKQFPIMQKYGLAFFVVRSCLRGLLERCSPDRKRGLSSEKKGSGTLIGLFELTCHLRH
jgi:hypothetical protein